jgi:putative oxidoreductase
MPNTTPRLETLRQRGNVVALTALRVGVGAILAAHGWAKLSDVAGTAHSFAHLGMPLPALLVYLAVAGEFVGGLGLVTGMLTRVAALGPLCTMLIAILTVHWGHGLFARDGGYEYPLTLLLVSLFFAFNGAGPFSVDAVFEKHPPKRLGRFFRGEHRRRALRTRHQIPT